MADMSHPRLGGLFRGCTVEGSSLRVREIHPQNPENGLNILWEQWILHKNVVMTFYTSVFGPELLLLL
jgi:hypothetical protein